MYVRMEDMYGSEVDFDFFRDKPVILFGAGSCGRKSVEEFQKINASIIGFCDNDKNKHGHQVMGITVLSPDDLLHYPGVNIIITSTFVEPIIKQMNELGITNIYVIRIGVLLDKLQRNEFHRSIFDKAEGNKHIYEGLVKERPYFVGRIGSVELECICAYCYFTGRNKGSKILYDNNIKMTMYEWAGFFPPEDEKLDEFVKIYLQDLLDVDVIWSMWLSRFENKLYKDYAEEKFIALYEESSFPIYETDPWTRALAGKKVLVIHPFEDTIKNNYKNRSKMFANPEFLPEFDLITLKAVQSIAGTKTEFEDWFSALQYMEKQIENLDFDIALIGAGAYGFPLAAHIKRMGKKAVHVGGVLQLYFGIKGKAWDNMGFYNEYWTYPAEMERPVCFEKVEGGRYW